MEFAMGNAGPDVESRDTFACDRAVCNSSFIPETEDIRVTKVAPVASDEASPFSVCQQSI